MSTEVRAWQVRTWLGAKQVPFHDHNNIIVTIIITIIMLVENNCENRISIQCLSPVVSLEADHFNPLMICSAQDDVKIVNSACKKDWYDDTLLQMYCNY